MSFFVTLQSNFQHVMLYESHELQQKAKNVIPHEQLSTAAKNKLKAAKDADPGEVAIQLKAFSKQSISIFLHVNYNYPALTVNNPVQ